MARKRGKGQTKAKAKKRGAGERIKKGKGKSNNNRNKDNTSQPRPGFTCPVGKKGTENATTKNTILYAFDSLRFHQDMRILWYSINIDPFILPIF